jgi:hypothetical protein
VIAALVALACLALAGSAHAYVYWLDDGKQVYTANLDGSNPQVIPGSGSGGSLASDGSHLYFWSVDPATDAPTIGQMKPDGSGVDQSFIELPSAPCSGGLAQANAIAVGGSYIYWADDLEGTIGRANVDGSGVNERFTVGAGGGCGSGGHGPEGVAVDASHIYWTNPDQNTIGRADLDGSGVTQSFITGAEDPTGIAVDGSNVYWLDANAPDNVSGWIGHASLDGSGAVIPSTVNQQFIGPLASQGEQTALAAFGGFVYFDDGDGWIGRATLDGSTVTRHLIQVATGSITPAIAVDAGQADPTATTVACKPSSLQVLEPLPKYDVSAFVNDVTKCTATVRDAAGASAPLNGTVAVSQAPIEGNFDLTDGTCTLAPTGTPGISSCSFQFHAGPDPEADVNNFVPDQTSTTIGAAYSGETTHEPSTASRSIPLQIVHACGLRKGEDGPFYSKICATGASANGSCIVPKLKGLALKKARHALVTAHCRLGKITRRKKRHTNRGRVIKSTPGAGTHLSTGAAVSLVVAK